MGTEFIGYNRTWTAETIQQLKHELTLVEELKSSSLKIIYVSPEVELMFSSILQDVDSLKNSLYATQKAMEWYMDTSEENLISALTAYEESIGKTSILFD